MDGHETKVACGFPSCQGSGVTHLVNRTKTLIVMGLCGFDAELPTLCWLLLINLIQCPGCCGKGCSWSQCGVN